MATESCTQTTRLDNWNLRAMSSNLKNTNNKPLTGSSLGSIFVKWSWMNMTRWNGTLFWDECASLLLNACILVSVLVLRIWWTLGSAIHRKSSQCHTSCNVTDYQLWRGPSSETQGQLVGAGKKFKEKIRAKKSQELLTFVRPFRFFPAPTNSPCVYVDVEGPGAIPCKARADQRIWQGFLGRDETSWVLATNNILSQVLLSTFFSHFSLFFSFQSWNWKSHH